MKKPVYLDNAASTKVLPEALKVLCDSLAHDYANPSAAHKLGKKLGAELEVCRAQFLQEFSSEANSYFVFTSSATESNNLIINSSFLKEADIYYCKADHPSLVRPLEALFPRAQALKLDSNLNLMYQQLEAGQHKKVFFLTHVNGQTGLLLDIEEISQNLKSQFPDCFIHVDASQSSPKINFKTDFIDSVSVSSHKMNGPLGIAGLFVKNKNLITPLFLGGGHEQELRSSTPSLALIKSFCTAYTLVAQKSIEHKIWLNKRKHELIQELLKIDSSLQFPFKLHATSPYILCFLNDFIPGDVLMRCLQDKDVIVSTTSACSSKIKGFNPVLNEFHIPEALHKKVLRVSFSVETTPEEVDYFLQQFKEVWNELSYLRG